MKVFNAPFGANATGVSATDRDTLVSNTGATWFSPDGQPIARPKCQIERMFDGVIREVGASSGRAAPPYAKPAKKTVPMNRAAVRAARVMDRYRLKAEALAKQFVPKWPFIGEPRFTSLDPEDRAGWEGVLLAPQRLDPDEAPLLKLKQLAIGVPGTTFTQPILRPQMRSRAERSGGQRMRELTLLEVTKPRFPKPEAVKVDLTKLDIYLVDPNGKERAK